MNYSWFMSIYVYTKPFLVVLSMPMCDPRAPLRLQCLVGSWIKGFYVFFQQMAVDCCGSRSRSLGHRWVLSFSKETIDLLMWAYAELIPFEVFKAQIALYIWEYHVSCFVCSAHVLLPQADLFQEKYGCEPICWFFQGETATITWFQLTWNHGTCRI